MTTPGTYWRTLRHLRPEQVVGRLNHRLHRARPDLSKAPPLRRPNGRWIAGAHRDPSLLGPQRFRFLSVEHELFAGEWDDPALARLWRYNLHYFDDLTARDAQQRHAWHRALVTRWIADNPPPHGTGWEPYPVSLRIVNWIKWALGGAVLESAWMHSLAVQIRWLRGRLETHLLGNHLFANAKALVFAGLFFDSTEAQRWLDKGLALVERELDEQILPDGGHFERSPMYHALALEDLLDLIDVLEAFDVHSARISRLTTRLRERVPAMQRWLRAMTHPDGSFGMFNDCAMGIAADRSELDRFAAELGVAPATLPDEGATHLDPSGYMRLATESVVALLDLAPIEPAYLPGHAHADTLSFELSLHGRRVVVNGGTSRYGDGPARQRERSTASHSTVQVAGIDSSEVWAGFRVGRRAHPLELTSQTDAMPWSVTCSHDGYRHLSGRPLHRREWRLDTDELVVEDHVQPARHRAIARYLFAASIRLRPDGATSWRLDEAGRTLGSVEVMRGTPQMVPAQVTTRFGVLDDTQCLAITLDDDGHAATRWRWSDDDAHPLSLR
jgi:uncharacterized heparinase superfamily protein